MKSFIYWTISTFTVGFVLLFLTVKYYPMANPEQVSATFIKYGCVKTNNFIVTNTRTNVDASERLYKCADGFEYPYSDIKWWATMELRNK